ncbi:transcription antitermination factor NusB [Bacteroidota bacterium]
MLNRRHIRIKVMQAIYIYWNSAGDKTEYQVEQEMMKSIYKLYDLYLYLLLFVKELTFFTEKYDSEVRATKISSAREIKMNQLFYSNKLIEKLNSSVTLEKELSQRKLIWDTEDVSLLRKVFLDLKNTEIYKEFINQEEPTDEVTLELFAFILKQYTVNFALLDQFLEEKFFNWLDDSKLSVQMAIKTFKNILSDSENDDILLPLSQDDDVSIEFAKELFNIAIREHVTLDKLIVSKIDKWEPSRIPLVDHIILQMGITEFMHFQSIPVKVTINECIELAKYYSTPNSKKFINGVLDNILTDLEKENKINKKGLGLLDK